MRKRLLSILTALCLCLTLLPTAALAEEEINTPAVTVISCSAWPEGGGEGFTDSGVENLFDGNPNTSWQWRYNGSNNPTWVQFETSEPISVARYTLSTGKTGGSPTFNPISWTLNASSDGEDWVQIASVTFGGLSSEPAQSSSFKVSPSFDKYKYFELRFTQCYGGRITLGEIELEQSTCPHTNCEETVTLPTCTKGGSTYRKCKTCHATQTTDFKPALGHDFGKDGVCTRSGCTAKRSDFQAVLKTASDLQYYTSVYNALNAAQEKTGCTVQMLSDAETNRITLSKGNFTLDLNGYTLRASSDLTFLISDHAHVTLVNTDSSKQAQVLSNAHSPKAFEVTGTDAQLTIGTSAADSNIQFIAESSAVDQANVTGYGGEVRDGGTLTVYGGSFQGKNAGLRIYDNGIAQCSVNIYNGVFKATDIDGAGLLMENGGSAKLYGGEFHGITPSGNRLDLLTDRSALSTTDSEGDIFDLSNSENSLAGTVYAVPHTHDFKASTSKCKCGLPCAHSHIDTETGICASCGQLLKTARYTAKNGDITLYDTLQEAINEAQQIGAGVDHRGSTVALLTDIDLHDSALDITNPNCDFIIDLNGKTLKTTGTLFNLLYFGQTLTIINTANKQAKIAAAEAFDIGHVSSVVNIGQDSGHSSIRFDLTETLVKYAEGDHVNAPMTVNIYVGEYCCTGNYALNVSVPYAVADIKGGEFTGKLGGVYAAGSGKLTAAGGKFLASDAENGYGLTINGSDAQVALSGGEYQGIQTDTRELSDLLAGGYGFKKADNSWLSTDELTRSDIKGTVTVEEAVISSLTVKINGEEVTGDSYVGVIGKAFSLSAVTDPVENVDVKWFQLSEESKNALTESTFTPVSAAPVTLRCEAQKDGYTIFKDITVTAVVAVGIVMQPTNASVTYGDTALPNELTNLTTEFESSNTVSAQWFVQSSDAKQDIALTKSKSLTSKAAYGEAAFSHTLNAGSYSVYCKMTIKSGSIISTVTSNVVTLTVQPKTLKAQDLEYTGSTNTKVYDGTTSAPAGAGVSVRSGALVGSDTLNVTGTIVYDTKDVTATQLIFTPDAIENGNYRLAADEVLTVPAGITPKMLTEFDFSGIAVTKVYDGGTSIGTLTGTVGFNGKVNTDDIFIKATPGVYADEKVGQNKHVTLVLNLEGTDKANYTLSEEDKTHEFTAASIMEADGSVIAPKRVDELRYNGKMQTLVIGGSSTTGEIWYRLGESGTYGTALPQAKDAGSYKVYYKVIGDSNHKDVEEKFVTAEIKAAELTVTAKDKNAYIGGKAPDLSKPELNKDYVVDGLIGEDHLIKAPVLSYDPAAPDMTKIGEAAKITANGADAGSNYSITYVAGKLILSRRSSSSGSVTYPVNVPDKTENGTVSVSPKNASKGDTVTVTVKSDSGYVLETISVTDKNGNDLKLTDKGNGKYTFTMPGSKVEIKVTFMEDNSVLNFFYDVPNDAYYYEAIKWAAENGVTGGIGNGLFGPNQPCTRAQIVTFLWRAAGSPVVNYLMPFTDVDEGAYYAEAVRWAASCGIVTGLTEMTFGTDSVCTRAQAAAMIYRCAQAQGKGFTGAWMFRLPFTDVPEWAYEPVAWCYMNGVTTGVSETSFAPGNACTRAQIVTFLWRAFGK